MAETIIAPVLIQARVAQYIHGRCYLDLYRCACGKEFVASYSRVKGGFTKSCGCWAKARMTARNTTHNLSKHPLANVRAGMVKRCHNKNHHAFHNYGGRGIKVCDEWRGSVEKFVKWGIANGWEPGLEIDRIDNDGDYEPLNCRFVTSAKNSQNRRNTLSPNIVTKIREMRSSGVKILDIASATGVNYGTVVNIIYGYTWKDLPQVQ